jgi:hypothetical protein
MAEMTKRFVAILAVVSVLSIAVTPRPARAVDTAWLVLGSIAAYVAAVAIGAYFVFRDSPNPPLMPSTADPSQGSIPGGTVGMVYQCPQRAGNLTVLCW